MEKTELKPQVFYQAVDEGLKGFKEIKILNKENYFNKMLKID